MELLGRHWDRWDGIVAGAALSLLVVSYQPWVTLHDEGLDTIWNAWTHWQSSDAVALGLLAAGVHLVYRRRPEARGAAWLAVALLLGGLALAGWHWQWAGPPDVKVVISYNQLRPGETPEQGRRRFDEELAALIANPPPAPSRSTQWGFYAGGGSLIVMFAAIGRRLVGSQLSGTESA